MKVIKALHVTPTDRKLLNALEQRIVEDGYKEDEGVGSKMITMLIEKINGDEVLVCRKQRARDDFGNRKIDYSRITIKIER